MTLIFAYETRKIYIAYNRKEVLIWKKIYMLVLIKNQN